MPQSLAQPLVTALTTYAVCGLAFVLLVLPRLVLRLDAGLHGAPVSVRLLLAPGLAALWPLFVWRLLTASPPPPERNAHRERGAVRPAVANRRSRPPS
jgi:hypothetical protein